MLALQHFLALFSFYKSYEEKLQANITETWAHFSAHANKLAHDPSRNWFFYKKIYLNLPFVPLRSKRSASSTQHRLYWRCPILTKPEFHTTGVTPRAVPKKRALPVGWGGVRATRPGPLALESSGQPASRRCWVAHHAGAAAPSSHHLVSPGILRADKRLRADGTGYHTANRSSNLKIEKIRGSKPLELTETKF